MGVNTLPMVQRNDNLPFDNVISFLDQSSDFNGSSFGSDPNYYQLMFSDWKKKESWMISRCDQLQPREKPNLGRYLKYLKIIPETNQTSCFHGLALTYEAPLLYTLCHPPAVSALVRWYRRSAAPLERWASYALDWHSISRLLHIIPARLSRHLSRLNETTTIFH